jgi:hypothetical protein
MLRPSYGSKTSSRIASRTISSVVGMVVVSVVSAIILSTPFHGGSYCPDKLWDRGLPGLLFALQSASGAAYRPQVFVGARFQVVEG